MAKTMKCVWTPWAELLCYGCHGRVEMQSWYGPGKPKVIDLSPEAVDQWVDKEPNSQCTRCKRPTWTESEEAMVLSTFVNRVEGLQLEQTGGMCMAAIMNRGGRSLWVTSGMSEALVEMGVYDGEYGEDEIEDTVWYLGTEDLEEGVRIALWLVDNWKGREKS